MKQIKYIADIGAEKSLVEFTDSTKIRIVESTDLIEHLNKQFSLSGVSQKRELLLGFQKSEWFDLYEQGVLEYKEAIEKYLA